MRLTHAVLLLVEPIQDLVVGTYPARTIKTDDREQTVINPITHVLRTFIEICHCAHIQMLVLPVIFLMQITTLSVIFSLLWKMAE